MNGNSNESEIVITPQEIQNAIAKAHRLRSQETARLLRVGFSALLRIARSVLHFRSPTGGARPLPH